MIPYFRQSVKRIVYIFFAKSVRVDDLFQLAVVFVILVVNDLYSAYTYFVGVAVGAIVIL